VSSDIFLDRLTLQTAVALSDLGMIKIASHCIYNSWALCHCHFCRFAHRRDDCCNCVYDRPSSKACRQASGRPTGV